MEDGARSSACRGCTYHAADISDLYDDVFSALEHINWILSQKTGDAADVVTQLSARSSPSTSRLPQPKQRDRITPAIHLHGGGWV